MVEPVRMRRERKVVTALFADLVGSTALTASLDPEDAMDVVGAAISAIVLVVEELEGTVKDLAGDGVLALFGAPVAHEDDPERAVRAGLRIVEAVAAADDRLDVRVGIDTGLVVLGPVGAGSRVEYGATGDAVNTAARLQGEADPGTVLVSATTQRLVADRFTWADERDLVLKGKAEPVRAATATGAVTAGGALRTYDRPIVGRAAELAVLTGAVDAVLDDGTPGIVVVTGEGGLGKSRLLDEARAHGNARRPFFNWVTMRCQSYEQTVPFAPLRRLIEGWLGVDAHTPADEKRAIARAGFAELLAGGGATDADLQTGVDLVLGLPGAGATDADEPAFRVAAAVEVVLARLLAHAPVVVAVEDVQWADRRTLELVDHLVDRVEELGVLLLITGRPVPGHAIERWGDLAASGLRATGAAVALGPLDPSTAEAHLVSLVGPSTLPIDLERSILASAEGNPYFVEELVRAMVDAGALVESPHGPVLDPAVAFEVPPTIERVVLERLDRLSDDLRRVVSAAAVVGRSFDLDLVAHLVDAPASSGADHGDDLRVAAKELVRLGLVEPAGEAWRFAHAVVHEAALHGMLRKEVRDLHRRLATFLDERPERATAGERALHWFEGGAPERAHALALVAADEADAAGATDEAVSQLDLALRAMDPAMPVDVGLLLRLADAQRRASRLDDALATFRRAADAADAGGDVAALADAAIGFEDTLFATRRPRDPDDPSVALLTTAAERLGDEVTGRRVRVLAALGRALAFAPGGRAEARAMAAGAVTLSRLVDDPCAAAYALSAWRTGELAPDRLELRLRHGVEALAAAQRADDDELWIEAARARFVDLLMAAQRDEADAVLEELRRRITAVGQPFHLWYLAMWDVQMAILDGDLDRASAGADAFRRQGRRLRYGDVDQVHAFQKLLILREQGRASEVLASFERLAALGDPSSTRYPTMVAVTLAAMGDDRAPAAFRRIADLGFDSLPDDQARGALLALVAEAAVAVGTPDDARAIAARLAPWAGQVLVVGSGAASLGAADHYLGLLAACTGDDAAARELLDRAEEVHTRLRAPLLLARSRAVREGLDG